ncbi:peptidase M24 (plasmid) [Gemmatirosa kalamazoonensis]|uniref:Xaa-Pro aminopeptidase n=1 Tax=Gemmatirosa kalamazoonensis TaxID=861299 RepID=W0RN08_9BACT|nr:aminopeptidase P N-terminal domain-containing protein [Gemmatirosa kalamazoonensis]AHG92424.1 peptidase M24 [Gemmatirosa kalamazoonensis]
MRLRLAYCLMMLVAALPSAARTLSAQIPAGEYADRRDQLLAHIDSGVVVAFGGAGEVTHWPPTRQLPSFMYLTGFDEPDAVLLLVKRGGARAATLFVPPRNPRMELFVGARVGPTEVQERTGMTGRPVADFRRALDSLLDAGLPMYVVSDVHSIDYAAVDTLTRSARFVEHLRSGRPALGVVSLDSVVERMRARKSPAELALLRRAAQISVAAHREAMRAAAPGCNEGEIQALMEGVFRRMGAERPSYGSIVGSGPNALVLHYDRNARQMEAGDLLLIDAAAEFDHYGADVTRTMPVSGRFTPAQRAVYDIVLAAQAAYVRQIRPGGTVRMANDSGRAVVGAGLARLGLIDSANATYDAPSPNRCPPAGCPQIGLYAWHGFGGHGIGLEVHDPAQYYDAPGNFAPGDVFTVEPGIYVNPAILDGLPDTPRNRALVARLRPVMDRYRNVGVRIEDDYAVTATGVEWLSAGVPREAAEIEALRRRPSPQLPGGGTCAKPRM